MFMKNVIKWDRNEILDSLPEFQKLYDSRPIKDNNGGMKSAHMLAMWFIIKNMKPEYIIESGVWKGLGTWLFEKASPSTKIISIDPEPRFREYTSPNVTYQTEDFLDTDWSHIPKENTLVFFDDHQNFIKRLKHAESLGFKKIIDEDNYPSIQGDCYSPKKVIANKPFVIDLAGKRDYYKVNPIDVEFFNKKVEIYQEMPPIYKPEFTRWGDEWSDENYPTPDPLLNISENEYPLFIEEAKDYTWLCYIELK